MCSNSFPLLCSKCGFNSFQVIGPEWSKNITNYRFDQDVHSTCLEIVLSSILSDIANFEGLNISYVITFYLVLLGLCLQVAFSLWYYCLGHKDLLSPGSKAW